MKTEWKKINKNNEIIEALVTSLDYEKDKKLIGKLYFQWKNLNEAIKKISTRGINLPEAISENAFCLFFTDCLRVNKLKGGKCSFDVINIKTGSRIQIKASSVEEDLTSFGPHSEFDEIYFLDFSNGNGSFLVYKIETQWIYGHNINKNQTFEEQQQQGRRPRFSIKKDIIKVKKLKPVKECKLPNIGILEMIRLNIYK
jgi:hypothetical protein